MAYPAVLYLKRLALQLPLPLILSAGVRRARAELRATEWIDAERLRSLADAKVRRLIAHVYASVPYYREVFERERIDPREIRGVDDLPRLPMLTKAIVRERFADLRAHDVEAHTPILGYTGGSTGQRSAHFVSRRCLAGGVVAGPIPDEGLDVVLQRGPHDLTQLARGRFAVARPHLGARVSARAAGRIGRWTRSGGAPRM